MEKALMNKIVLDCNPYMRRMFSILVKTGQSRREKLTYALRGALESVEVPQNKSSVIEGQAAS